MSQGGVGWFMQGWGGSCRSWGWVSHVGVGWVIQGLVGWGGVWGASWWGGVGLGRVG